MRRFILLCGLTAIACLLSGCFVPAAITKSEEIATDMMERHEIESVFLENPIMDFHYVARRSSSKILFVFVHGTPGTWRIFSPQLNNESMAELASMVAIDRPGWGESVINQGEYTFSLADQSQKISFLLADLKQNFNADKLILVGHSLGASLVPRVAMDFPEYVDGVIAIAGDLTEQYSAERWYNGAASAGVVNWMLSSEMQKANDEVMALDRDLKAMAPMWEDLQVPMMVIQGLEDKLVDPRHADFAEKLNTKAKVEVTRINGGGHLMHIDRADEVNRLMLDFVQRLP